MKHMMNKKDFQRYMKQGLGRCALELQSSENIEKYKEIVLWGCLHNLAYDTQSEGTRASYLYQLTTYFHDEDYFLLPCIEAFEKISRKNDWLFAHFAELLCNFALNGNERAKNTLYRKYTLLLDVLSNKRRFRGYDFERDNFERICVTLFSLDGTESLLKIASDMGHLFQTNPRYGADDFEWFFDHASSALGKKRFLNLLKQKAKKSEHIRISLEQYLHLEEENTYSFRKTKENPNASDLQNEVNAIGKLSPSLKVRFFRHADTEEKRKLAQSILTEPDPDKKAELLQVFTCRDESFPAPHETLIEYAKSSHEKLREAALDALTNCRSDAVRDYALTLLSDEKDRSRALKILICNYMPNIKNLLLTELYQIKVDYKDESDWHSLGLKILDVCDQNVKLPKEFLVYIYETTLCSCCREYAILALAKHRWLTSEIIEECRYDCNSDISAYVNRYYPSNKSV